MPADLRVVLASLKLLHDSTDAPELPPERVNDLLSTLGLSAEASVRMMEEAQAQGLVVFRWGGGVALTDAGRARAEGREDKGGGGGISIHVNGPNSGHFAIGNGNVQGTNAMGHGSTRTEVMPLAELAALLTALRTAPVPESAKPAVDAVREAATAAVKEAAKPEPDKATLAENLDHLTKTLENAGKARDAVDKLLPFDRIRAFIDWAGGILG